MAKARETAFFCKECGFESAKWLGQCPACKEWNTLVEAPIEPKQKELGMRGLGSDSLGSDSVRVAGRRRIEIEKIRPSKLSEIVLEEQDRIASGFAELDRVLGGGIVRGSLVLVGGDPGIGKSTLLLQVCRMVSGQGQSVLYISGEESLKQIKLRANRIGTFQGDMTFLCETNLDTIRLVIEREKPDMVIIDSIQTMFREGISSAPGSIGQVRESTNLLMQIAKGLGIAIFIVGHVTKEGVVAGPRVLEHMVDTVLYFEGEKFASYRILRGVKNRFGSTNEIGVFEMCETGLAEVENPSEFMLEGRPKNASGAVVACSMEGSRPILLEIQALVAESNFGMPRRTAAGTDYNRVNLLMAVLEKRCHYEMSRMDAYINIAGGIKMSEPALDLAIVMALISSYKDRPVAADTMIFGEVGLSGEVRAVAMADQRVREAEKLGFHTCILPQSCLEKMGKTEKVQKEGGIQLIGVSNVREAIQFLT